MQGCLGWCEQVQDRHWALNLALRCQVNHSFHESSGRDAYDTFSRVSECHAHAAPPPIESVRYSDGSTSRRPAAGTARKSRTSSPVVIVRHRGHFCPPVMSCRDAIDR